MSKTFKKLIQEAAGYAQTVNIGARVKFARDEVADYNVTDIIHDQGIVNKIEGDEFTVLLHNDEEIVVKSQHILGIV